MNNLPQPDKPQDPALALIRQRLERAMAQAGRPMGQDQASDDRPDPSDKMAYQAWYAGLSNEQKAAEWHRYNSSYGSLQKHHQLESQASKWSAAVNQPADTPGVKHTPPTPSQPAIEENGPAVEDPSNTQPEFNQADLEPNPKDLIALGRRAPKVDSELIRRRIAGVRMAAKDRAKRHNHTLKSLRFAALVGISLLAIIQNQLLIAQAKSYISPGASVGQSNIIISNNEEVGPESKIIIPKIGVEVPVVFDQTSLSEDAIQTSLEDGVVRYNYPGTVLPGQVGNSVILGHSSSSFFGSGQYKFAFVLLNRLDPGDTFIIHHQSTRYIYRIMDPGVVVPPTDFSEITEQFDKPVVTLITCDPPGTNINRYIIQGEQVSPSPETAETPDQTDQDSIEAPQTVPSNSRGFFDNLF